MEPWRKGDPLRDRAAEKVRSRTEDEQALASGEKSLEVLRTENGHFAGLQVRVDLRRAKAFY